MQRLDHLGDGVTVPQIYWNVDSVIGPGNVGDDVRLVQYLLNYRELSLLPGGPVTLIEVDGVWGTATSAAVSRLEGDERFGSVHDGVISPIPPAAVTVGTNYWQIYKLAILHWIYGAVRNGVDPHSDISRDDLNNAVIDMPENFDCPPELAYALKTARGY